MTEIRKIHRKDFTMITTDLETTSGIKQQCNYSIFKKPYPGFEVNSLEFCNIHFFFCYYLVAPNKPQYSVFVSVILFVGQENGGWGMLII